MNWNKHMKKNKAKNTNRPMNTPASGLLLQMTQL